jgi:hypothetical protein
VGVCVRVRHSLNVFAKPHQLLHHLVKGCVALHKERRPAPHASGSDRQHIHLGPLNVDLDEVGTVRTQSVQREASHRHYFMHRGISAPARTNRVNLQQRALLGRWAAVKQCVAIAAAGRPMDRHSVSGQTSRQHLMRPPVSLYGRDGSEFASQHACPRSDIRTDVDGVPASNASQ